MVALEDLPQRFVFFFLHTLTIHQYSRMSKPVGETEGIL